MDSAATSSSFLSTAYSRVEIDLRVTKETHHLPRNPYLAVELQNYAEWSLSRNHVPYALAQKGITLHDWTDVFDKADALWERHAMEAIELSREIMRTLKSHSSFIITFYMLTYGLLVAIMISGVVIGTPWLVGLGFVTMAVAPIMVCVLLPKLTGSSDVCDVNNASMEQHWSLLAEEQRHKFYTLGVDVQPIREGDSVKLGKILSKMLGIDFTITDGLRFSFFQHKEQQLPSTRDKKERLPMLCSGPTSVAVPIHDLDRLLQLNQTGDVECEEYQLLKSRILSKMSLPFHYMSLPKASH